MAPSTILCVYILAGQSNMAGRGDGADLPAAIIPAVDDVEFRYVCSFGADRGSPFSEGGAFHSDGWEKLRPCRKHPSTPGTHFGPEIGFAVAMKEHRPRMRMAILKYGRGGSRLATDWARESADGRGFYEDMIKQVREALRTLEEGGTEYKVGGFIWMQGEGDTTHFEYAEAYEENLRRLLAAVREELGEPHLPVVIGRIGDGSRNPKMLYAADVRGAQGRIGREDPDAATVDTDDLPLGDFVHYNSAGLLILGRRFANAIVGLDAKSR